MPHCTFCASGVYMRCFYRQIEAIQFDNVYMLRYYLVEGEERYRSVGLTSRGRLLSVPWMIRKGRVRAVRLSWSEPMNKPNALCRLSPPRRKKLCGGTTTAMCTAS